MFMPMVMEAIEEQLVQLYNRRTLLLELVEALGKYASSAHIEVFRLLWDDSPLASPLPPLLSLLATHSPLEMDTNKNRSIHFLHSGEVVFTITSTSPLHPLF
jgi:hypothetical protein